MKPQILVDKVHVMGQEDASQDSAAFSERQPPSRAAEAAGKKLYVRLRQTAQFDWLRKLFQMFPGEETAIIYFDDTKKKLKAGCVLHSALIQELQEKLGGENVVLK